MYGKAELVQSKISLCVYFIRPFEQLTYEMAKRENKSQT